MDEGGDESSMDLGDVAVAAHFEDESAAVVGFETIVDGLEGGEAGLRIFENPVEGGIGHAVVVKHSVSPWFHDGTWTYSHFVPRSTLQFSFMELVVQMSAIYDSILHILSTKVFSSGLYHGLRSIQP